MDASPDLVEASESGTMGEGGTVPDASAPDGGVAVAVGQDHPTALFVYGSKLYWINASISSSASIMAAPTTGGTATTIVSGLGGPVGLAVDSTYVYWADSATSAIAKQPLAGGNPTTLAANQDLPVSLVIDQVNAYWTTNTVSNAVSSVGLGGGAVKQLSPAFSPAAIAARNSTVFWVNEGLGGQIALIPAAGGTATTLASAQAGARFGIAADDAFVYWTTFETAGTVRRAPIDGGAVDTMASGQPMPTSLTADGTAVYWVDYGSTGSDGTVLKQPVSGGSPVTLGATTCSRESAFQLVAVDQTSVYWSDYMGGRIMRAAK